MYIRSSVAYSKLKLFFMKNILVIAAMLCCVNLFAQKNASVSFEQWISLKSVGGPVISPDGKIIVYSTTTTDWAENAYDYEHSMRGTCRHSQRCHDS